MKHLTLDKIFLAWKFKFKIFLQTLLAGKFKILKSHVSFNSFRHGNKAEIWQDLIDQKKLPYLATIRNLRNLILAGISDSHVDKVCAYIQNEKAVAKSRMFPFRFYTAFDVLSDLENFSQESYKEPKKTIGNAQLITKFFMILSPGCADF